LWLQAGLRIQAWLRARKARIELQNTDPQLAARLKDCRGNVEAPPAAKKAFEAAGDIMRHGPQSTVEQQRVVDLYQEALEKGYPRKGRCLNGAGMGLCMLGRLQEGYDCFTKAISEDRFDARRYAIAESYPQHEHVCKCEGWR
jgi:Tfp pilus assembly protein PilF